jgi:hypothetical protein
MKVATYEGFVEGGQVKLTEDVHLPERAKVYVVVPEAEAQSVPFVASPRLRHPEQAKDFVKKTIEE